MNPARRAVVATAALHGIATPRWATAQPAARHVRIGFLSAAAPDAGMRRNFVEPLLQGLRELGYAEGRNLSIDYRWAEGRQERLPALLAELLALAPDILVTTGPRPPLLAKEASSTLPVVAIAVDDPVAMGLAATYARPGRNITGIVGAFQGILAKRLQLLKEVAPRARRFGVLLNPATASREGVARGLGDSAGTLGVQVAAFEATGPDAFEAAFAEMVRERIEGVVVLADSTFYIHRTRLAELCTRNRLPSVWGGVGYLDAGGLASYQGDFAVMSRRAAAMVDKIVRGAKPGDIPFEQATKLELGVNIKAARALGITLPASMLVSADVVIE